MTIELTAHETRVIGCLIEKQITTPEQYPLSLNALTNACNQKSNRAPILALAEDEVQNIVDGLIKKFQVSEHGGYGSRVPKYEHRFCNTEFGTLKFTSQELSIICELFLRGPQTPGELRTHASRLCHYNDVSEIENVLDTLTQRGDGPFVVHLPLEPGRRESRYAHSFGGKFERVTKGTLIHESLPAEPDRVALLEQRVAALEAIVAEWKAVK